MPRTLADLAGTNLPTFRLGKPPTRAVFDASGLTAPRTLTVQDAAGTLALTADVAAAQAAAQAYAIQRANHTGTQLAVTISDFAAAALAATAAAYDPVGSAAAAQAYAIQRANHTGTQLAVTISDFASAVVAAGSGVWQPLSANLTGLASDYTAATKALVCSHTDAATSAGLHIGNNTHQDVAMFGAGGSQGTTLYGQLNCLAIDSTSASGVLARTAATQDAIRLLGRAGGTSSRTLTLTTAALGADRTATFPDATLTVAGQNIDNAFSAAQTFAGSVPGTPTSGQVLIGGGAIKAGGAISGASLTATGLTPGRIAVVSTGGLLADDAGLTFAAPNLTLSASVDGSVQHLVRNTDAVGAAAQAQITVANGTSPTANLLLGAWGAGRTGLQFGVSRANAAFLYSATAAITSLVIGHTGSSGTVVIGSNNAAICTFTTTGITAAQAVTVPNGTAAAPGIRLTSGAHGLYRAGATTLGVAVAGVSAMTIAAPGGTYGGLFVMATPSAAEYGGVLCSATNSYVILCGGTGAANSGQIRAYGSTHATKGDYVEFLRANTVSAYFDGSGILTLNNTTDASAIGTAAMVGLGGASIAKSLWVGGTAGNYINIANATGELRVNGTKVLGAQGAAVADATGAGDVVAQLNALLARCRAHGLIAT